MDYHTLHGHDVSSFDLPSTHRLPTVSAADALEDLNEGRSQYVSSGLEDLDQSLALGVSESGPETAIGGFVRGQVTEIWGPPGAGKTTIGIQLAANALRDGNGVVWVDGFYDVCYDRLTDFYASESGSADQSDLERFIHYRCPSLPHFLALVCRPTVSCIPEDTSLIVIDSLSALVNHAFPRTQDLKTGSKGPNKGTSSSARRLQVLQYIIGAIQKLAATRNIAIVVLTQCATRMQADRRATLIPGINANSWEQGITTRLVVFRDWIWKDDEASNVHLIGVQKVNGKAGPELIRSICAFRIAATKISGMKYDSSQQSITLSTPAQKRKLGDTEFEVPDSDDEDYGWQNDDDGAMPAPPPQWQGSEDILLGTCPDSGDEVGDSDGGLDDSDDEQHATAKSGP